MAELSVNFVNPQGRMLTVTLDESMTPQEAISEMLNADFIVADSQGYRLAIKGGALLEQSQPFSSNQNIQNGTTLRILPATDAGSV